MIKEESIGNRNVIRPNAKCTTDIRHTNKFTYSQLELDKPIQQNSTMEHE